MSTHCSMGSSAGMMILTCFLSSLNLSKIQAFWFERRIIIGSCKEEICESGLRIIEDFNPALAAAREKRPFALLMEKSSGASAPGSIGSPSVRASAENGLW